MKAPYLSKTLWINAIVAAVAFFPGAQTYVQAHPALLIDVFAGINFALRFFTKNAIGLGD